MGGLVTEPATIRRFDLDIAQRSRKQAMAVVAAELVVGTGQRKTRRAVIEAGLDERDFRVVTTRAVLAEGVIVWIRVTC